MQIQPSEQSCRIIQILRILLVQSAGAATNRPQDGQHRTSGVTVSNLLDGPWPRLGDTNISTSDALTRRRQRTSETARNTAAEDHDAAHGWHQMNAHRRRFLVRSLASAGAMA